MKIPTLQCNRCEHEWYPRSPKEPKVCPKCNSPYWNKERKFERELKGQLVEAGVYCTGDCDPENCKCNPMCHEQR